MIVTVNGEQLIVKFFYSRPIETSKGVDTLRGKKALTNTGGKGLNIKTECEISVRRQMPDSEEPVSLVLGQGSASTDSRDQFIKDIGRKLSLARALVAFKNNEQAHPFGDNKEVRTAIWQQYFREHRSSVDPQTVGSAQVSEEAVAAQ